MLKPTGKMLHKSTNPHYLVCLVFSKYVNILKLWGALQIYFEDLILIIPYDYYSPCFLMSTVCFHFEHHLNLFYYHCLNCFLGLVSKWFPALFSKSFPMNTVKITLFINQHFVPYYTSRFLAGLICIFMVRYLVS